MPKKRSRGPDLNELLSRPFCYYCDKDVDDALILMDHMKAKHLRCELCPRRLNTAGGLKVHMSQVHKEDLLQVHNAIPGREGITPEIFGMTGVPEDFIAARTNRITQEYWRREHERRAATGNPAPGAAGPGNPAKKQKTTESQDDMLKRLAEHRAKKAAIRAAKEAGIPYVEDEPATNGESPASSDNQQEQGVEAPAQPQAAYPPPNSASPLSYGANMPPSMPPNMPQAAYGSFPQDQPPPGYPPMPQPSYQMMAPQYQPQPHYQAAPPPISPNSYVPYNGPASALPSAPGLPQRPGFSAPGLTRQQMSQMHPNHQAQSPPQAVPGYGPPVSAFPNAASPPRNAHYGQPPNAPSAPFQSGGASQNSQQALGADFDNALDSLIKSGGQQNEQTTSNKTATPANHTKSVQQKPTEITQNAAKAPAEEKSSSKFMMYGDDKISPEEKMATSVKYMRFTSVRA